MSDQFPPSGSPRRASYETQRLQQMATDRLAHPQPERPDGRRGVRQWFARLIRRS